MSYDLIVAGAGIAGLHVATRYVKAHPTHSLLLVERNNYLGGRIYTHHQTVKGKGQYQWEAGAGRIPVSHKRIIGLIKEYGLTFQRWEAPPNLHDPFPDLIPVFLEPLQSLPASVLAENTLSEILHQIHGSNANRFMALFPYWAEFHTLRADVALEAFLRGPLGGQGEWGGCAEGLSALVERMGADVEARGGVVQKGVSVLEVQPLQGGKGMRVLLENNGKRYHVDAKKVVMALDAGSLRKVKGVADHVSSLTWLKSEPLLRVYAVFPTHNGKSWFSGMAKEVVPGPIRFFIPMQADRGLAMISYTEGPDALYWMRMPEPKRKKEMMRALRELYKEKEIPDPLFVKFHGWTTGCTYWLPGRYDAIEESEQSVQPVGGLPLYVCSESFALQQSGQHGIPAAGPRASRVGQSWMESGLEQADRVLTKLLS